MKKFLAMVLVLVMALALVSCGDANSGEAKQSGNNKQSSGEQSDGANEGNYNKTLVIGITTDPQTIGWTTTSTGTNQGSLQVSGVFVSYALCDIPDLVTGEITRYYVMISGMEQTDDVTYVLHIRDGIYDTDGNDVTASDFAFSYDIAKQLGGSTVTKMMDSMTVIDEHTLELKFTEVMNVGDVEDFLAAQAVFSEKAYNEAVAAGNIDNNYAVYCTGLVLDEYVPGSYIRFKKSDIPYWNEKANETKSIEDGYCPQYDFSNIDVLEYRIITDSSTLALALEGGDVDLSPHASVNDALTLGSSDKFNVVSKPDNMYALACNASSDSPLNNLNLRKAILYCIDANGCLNAAYDGYGTTLNAFAIPMYTDYQDEWDANPGFTYNMDKAKQYLAAWEQETGKKASDLSLTLMYTSGSTLNKTAQAVQSYIGTLLGNSTAVELMPFDRGTFNTQLKDSASYDMCLLNCQTTSRTVSTYNWSYFYDLRKNSSEPSHSDDDKLQELLVAAVLSTTHSDETVNAFERYIEEQAYVRNLIMGDGEIVAASWIGNLEHSLGAKATIAFGNLDIDWAASGK